MEFKGLIPNGPCSSLGISSERSSPEALSAARPSRQARGISGPSASLSSAVTPHFLRQLGSRGDLELLVHLPQVVFDGGRADEQLGGDDDVLLGCFVLPEMVEAATRAGDHEAAAVALDRLTERATASGTTWRSGYSPVCRRSSPEMALLRTELGLRAFAERAGNELRVSGELFLSSSTVEYHLRKVFRKLGVVSRTQLAHAIRAQDNPEGPLPKVPG